MKALEFKEQNLVYAKGQPQYLPLPCHRQADGTATFGFELDFTELIKITRSKEIHLTILAFFTPIQPMRISINKPALPITEQLEFMYTPMDEPENVFTFCKKLTPAQVEILNLDKQIWVTVLTNNKPLHPIQMEVS